MTLGAGPLGMYPMGALRYEDDLPSQSPVTWNNFEADYKTLGFTYQVLPSAIRGSDPDRPELGEIAISLADTAPQTVRDAKKQLMTIFCRNLPSNLQLTRISFKELT